MSPTATTNESTTAESKMSEAEFLDAQAADARAAIHETWNELKGTLRETVSLEVWARRHPWLVAGTAVAGGFLIATTLLRSKEEEPNVQPDVAPQGTAPPGATPRRGSHWLIETLFGLLKPVLGQLVTAILAGAMGAVGGSMSEVASEQEPDGGDWSQDPSGQAAEGPVPM